MEQNYGGSVWHASIAPRRIRLSPKLLEERALAALEGVGDATLGEWREMGAVAFHIRRRTTPEESAIVGELRDIRGTAEVTERLRPVRHLLPAGYTE